MKVNKTEWVTYLMFQKHMERFKLYVEHFANYFGLHNYLVEVSWSVEKFENPEYSGPNSFATNMTDTPGMCMWIELARHWPDREPTNYNLAKVAFHEVFEGLMCSCEHTPWAQTKIPDGDKRWPLINESLESARHTVVRTLENSFFETWWTHEGHKI